MIKDHFSNIERYKINKYFDDFIKWAQSKKMEEHLPDVIKAINLEYETKNFDLSKFENHQKYIDLHYVLEGEEYIGIQDIKNLVPTTDYEKQDDYQLFEGEVKEKVHLQKGDILALFTNEAHVTGGMVGKSERVHKIVYKIPISE